MSPAVAEGTPVQKRVFYAQSANLVVQVNVGKRVMQSDGQMVDHRLNQKIVQFSPIGDGWGQLVTDDPEVIAFLEKTGDVVGPESYNRATTPPEVRNQQLEAYSAELQRTIDTQNRLIEDLKKQGKSIPPTRP